MNDSDKITSGRYIDSYRWGKKLWVEVANMSGRWG